MLHCGGQGWEVTWTGVASHPGEGGYPVLMLPVVSCMYYHHPPEKPLGLPKIHWKKHGLYLQNLQFCFIDIFKSFMNLHG